MGVYKMQLLVIDNYDSFTYNLVQYLGELGVKPVVYRNDEITIEKMEKMDIKAIVISPGPCTPLESGISNEVIKHFAGKLSLLGVCLGHQCIGYVFNAKIIKAPYLMHGRTSLIYHDGETIFQSLPNPFIATRYHSLIIEKESLPDCFEISAWTEDNIIMGIRHKIIPFLEGIQFHPESILTEVGKNLLANFLCFQGFAKN